MLETGYPSQVFLGIHFVLFGFDPISESKVRFKLVNGGGVDVGQYSPSCTHIIVGKLAYDDPVCVAARNDGKTLVTALWVDHSADIGMPVDVTSVMYRPLKDLKGIPGAKNLILCLTGYQRQDRDDIMTMVGLMGAQFSKPLVANKVTHLICYKFEGEKYELAKRLKTIKLVNHRWLEDCLKYWVLLPEDKYKKSGYELELMVEEAKDSEEEGEDVMSGKSGGRNIIKSPLSSKISTAITHSCSKPVREASNAIPDSTAPEGLLKENKGHDSLYITGNENRSDQALSFRHADDLKISCGDPGVSRHDASGQLAGTCAKIAKPRNTDVPKAVDCPDLGIPEHANSSSHIPDLQVGTSEFGKLVNDLKLTSESAERLAQSDAKGSSMNYSRKNLERFSPPRNLNECLGNLSGPSGLPLDDMKFGNNHLETSSSSKVEKSSDRIGFPCVEGSGKGNDFNRREPISLLPQKRTSEASSNSKSKVTAKAKLSNGRVPSANGTMQGLKQTSLMNEPPATEDHFSAGMDGIRNAEIVNTKPLQCDNASVQTPVRGKHDSKINENDQECYPRKKSLNEESAGLTTLDLCNEAGDKFIRNSPRRKTVAKKCLGSRRKLGATVKQKGSIALNRSAPQGDTASYFTGCKETCDDEKFHTSSKIVDFETSLQLENGTKSAENAIGGEFLDDETEAPDDKFGGYNGMDLDENNAELVHLSKKTDTLTEEKAEAIHHRGKCEESVPPKEGTNETEQEAHELVDSTSKVNEKHKRRKLPAGRIKKTTVAKDVKRSKEAVCGIKNDNERKDKAEMGMLEKVSLPVGKNDGSAVPTNNSENFLEMEKENRPIDGEKDSEEVMNVGNSVIKASVGLAKINEKAKKKMALNLSPPEDNKRAKGEAACFIVSGHRLQRKEFQQIIRRLKGRVCRDSHQWSYQATHSIVPDPLRRTEKFFAAAASGRWILKTDYLTACSQAGKFLAEEPYEWHKSGLSEDGAINMEAPRKWRLLKERTGHGALYGMRIIIYGDCIAPPLDTLKRVVKAGDGTILATSPPYTRFLDTGIDYAIVSPGMPRVDLWVQEFLKHEIPCVLADYLVEYVCKPGFSLDKHVLYGTHSWAEKSFANLQSRAEEVIDNPAENSEDNDNDNDAACQVCGSRDRGDVMLLCGDESGSVGCGVGMHIDCCDPPLKEVPGEDWFCSKCSKTRNCSNSSKKRKKSVLSSSRIK
ncbi:BRCT domain-containing protein [Senna tora]|uniref:BRCT domain-containing protein n=1 Tax=Senna tora TaxID=362788 RepID=A0A834SIQ4_9FABA|nr:BRCT domain-containing protein [Senna tora]